MKRALVAASLDPRAFADRREHGYDLVVLPFWCSPELIDQVRNRFGAECAPLRELIPNYPASVQAAYEWAHRCANEGPSESGIRLLRGWENHLSNFLLRADLNVRLAETLAGNGVTHVHYTGDSENAQLADRINRLLGNRFQVTSQHADAPVERSASSNRAARWLNLAAESRRDGDWRQVLWVPIETLDLDYAWRRRFARHESLERNGILFYSSYVNYSRALSKHRDARQAVTWVTNNYSGRTGVPPNERRLDIWQFGKGQRAALPAESTWLANLGADGHLGATESVALRDVLESSPVAGELATRIAPLVAAEIDLLRAGLEAAAPREIWVANQWGSEAAVISLGRKLGVPVTQVQHGSLEQYYGCAPIYSDRFLVWGDLWKQAVNPAERAKVEIVNPGMEMASTSRAQRTGNPRVTFFTAPVGITGIPFWSPEVARWEAIQLLQQLAQAGHPILIRVHPADRIEYWRRAWIEHGGDPSADLRFDKTSALEDVLAETDVAVMYFSTVFMNCCASGIPVVSLAWYPNAWRELLEREQIVHFADSLSEAFDLVHDLGGRPVSVPTLSRVLAPVG